MADGVAGDQPRLGELVQHPSLETGVDVGEKDKGGVPITSGQDRREVRKDVELQVEGIADVHIFMVPAGPAKGPPFSHLQSFEINIAGGQKGPFVSRKVRTDHRDQLDPSKITCRYGKVRGRSSQDFFCTAVGRLDRIKGH